ncbi:MAG: T9SS type A sorting domain-containing protein, partial [Bacteroidales bacterium]|nr:T9SS type A sorting domain-containing protein [Bacteroidales bacterium]
ARAGGPFGFTGNDISLKMTTDGVDFDSVTFVSTTGKRYPGGTFFRDGADLYVVSAGPVVEASWSHNYVYSAKIDGTNAADTLLVIPAGLGLFHMNEGLTVLETGELFIIGEKNGPEAEDFPHVAYTIWKFMWNSIDKKFNFVSETDFTPDMDPDMPPVQPQGLAFSPSGDVGYFWVNLQDADPLVAYNLSTQPAIWKTIDKGETWTRMPNYDYGQVEDLKEHVWPIISDEEVIRPVFFYGYTSSDKLMPGVVDHEGNLHLLVRIVGGYSVHPDSLDYTFVYEPQKIFDLYTKTDGTWGANLVDSLESEVYKDKEEFGDFALDHRIHMARTEDGTRIFAIWTDTQGEVAETNIAPDLKAKGFNLTDNTQTIAKNFTTLTPTEFSILYMNASDIAINDNDTYKIPVVYISGDTPENEILHHYLAGVEFDADFAHVSVNDIDQNFNQVSQSYPNPTSGMTSVDVTLVKGSNLSIQVVNIMGQVVYTENKGNVSEGKYRFNFDASQLNSGIYFYTVKAGNSNHTSKMIVQ